MGRYAIRFINVGVKQDGRTSPKLFSLYVNRLIHTHTQNQLRHGRLRCGWDFVNNISMQMKWRCCAFQRAPSGRGWLFVSSTYAEWPVPIKLLRASGGFLWQKVQDCPCNNAFRILLGLSRHCRGSRCSWMRERMVNACGVAAGSATMAEKRKGHSVPAMNRAQT